MGLLKTTTVEQRKKRRGLLRAFGYLALLSGAVTFVQIRQARAEIGDKTVELGRQMFELANASHQDVNRLTMNGEQLFIGSSLSKDSVISVLDRYEALCNEKRAQSIDDWKGLADADGKKDAKKASGVAEGGGVMRSGTRKEGTVLCFTKTATSKPTVSEALTSFAETGDFGALGAVRYVYVHETQSGGSSVLTAWTDERFSLKAFVIKDPTKDAPGTDFAEIPRPVDGVRVLSGRVEDTPFGMNVYRGKASPTEVVAAYDAQLLGHGWVGVDPQLEEHEKNDPHHPVGRLYEKNGVVLTVASHLEPNATFTALGLAGYAGGDGTGAAQKKALYSKRTSLVPGGPAPQE